MNYLSFVVLGRGNVLNAGTIRNPPSSKQVDTSLSRVQHIKIQKIIP